MPKKNQNKIKVQQHQKDMADVNKIMAGYRVKDVQPVIGPQGARYGDFSDIGDYHTALNEVQQAQEMFMSLPASMRERFQNDPGRLIAFVEDPQNLDQAVELGLVQKPLGAIPEAIAEGDDKEIKPIQNDNNGQAD